MPDEITNTAPQLSPIQQQFVQSLGDAPSNAVPFSAGPGLQGFSAPGYAAGYQPAQSFDDPAYQKSLYEWEQEVRRKAEASRAEQAVQAGMRYIYQQRYDADLKKGVPEPQAFSKMMLGIAMHTPKSDPVKMFQAFQQPFTPSVTNIPGAGPVLRSGRYGERATIVPPALGEGPLKGVPVLNPDGTTNENYIGVPSATGRGFTIHPKRAEQPTATLGLQDRQLRDKIKTIDTDLSNLNAKDPADKPQYDLLKAQRDTLQLQRDALTQPKVKGEQPAAPKSASTNEVTRVTKEGRKAIFDATTKKFLRYATD